MRHASVLDVLGENAWEDCAVVFPSMQHALVFWPILIEAYKNHHGADYIVTTKTAIVSRRTKRTLRVWVPHTRLGEAPEVPMDHERVRRGFRLLDLYGMSQGRV